MTTVDATLADHGADLEALHRFDDEAKGPDLLPYATLVTARQARDQELDPLIGVYEWQDNPLIFLVDGEALRDADQLRVIRRRLALRGDAPYLGVVRSGRLTVYQVSLDSRSPTEVSVPESAIKQTFTYLASDRPGLGVERRQWISEVVLRLLDQSITELMNVSGIGGDEAISLVGRALFTRFLADRNLLPSSLSLEGSLDTFHLFDNAAQAEATSRWLDDTFNGEFLPLRPGLFDELPTPAFYTLGNVLRRAERGQLYLDWQEDWAHLDFAHIPVGVLSQAYELYLRNHSADQQRKEGGYYTPRVIAQLVVNAAFHALRRGGVAHEARILDPAAGAGVFLLTGFRQLVAERWRHDGVRPDTKALREILYRQITGFDINESALRFAALGLYLLSIELDPHPEPVEKLRFQDLRENRVLQKVGDPGSLGSLGDAVQGVHNGRYDLVVGNPPWASSTQLVGWPEIARRVRRIAEERLPGSGKAKLLPNEPLDIPFVWRAMEWAKPGGQIAFALHARLLFQQHEGMPEARAVLFNALDVTGIFNGAELRQSNVWPEVSAPFCLLFARNAVPPVGASFRFVSPHLEDGLNRSGHLRLDAGNAELVTGAQVAEKPQILKILFRGGPLDLEVYERGFARGFPSLRTFWQKHFGGSGRRLNQAGNGYQRLRPSSPMGSDGERGASAKHLIGMPELTPEAMRSLWLDRTQLGVFNQDRLHRTRDSSVFRGPLLLVHESPPAGLGRIRVAVTDGDVVFNQSYHGYSASRHPHAWHLVRYLALLVGSRPAFWHYLVTSGRFGFERDVVEKATIDSIPVPDFQELGTKALKEIEALFDAVVRQDDEQTWAQVDAWAARLYGLRQADLQIIDDTLRYNLPFAANRKLAQLRPKPQQLDGFCEALADKLTPWAQRGGNEIRVLRHPLHNWSPWLLVQILRFSQTATPDASPSSGWMEVLHTADQLAATEVLYEDAGANCLWVAKLAQARYWSHSQAYSVSRRIIWEHPEFLMSAEKA